MFRLTTGKYSDARDAICRYLELCPHDNAERIHGAIVVANRSIMDIDSRLEAFDADDPGLSVFYQLVIKVDCLIGAVEHLYWKLLYPDTKERDFRARIDDVWEVDLQSIKRLYLSTQFWATKQLKKGPQLFTCR